MSGREKFIIAAVTLAIAAGAAMLFLSVREAGPPDAPEPAPRIAAEEPAERAAPEASPPPPIADLPAEPAAVETAAVEPAAEGPYVTGRVTDQRSGAGIPGVTVRAVDADLDGFETAMGRRGAEAVSDDDGVYRITGLKAERYRIVPEGRPAGYLFPQDQARVIDVAEDASVEGVDYALAPGGRIFGTVYGDNGQPMAGAEVTVTPGGGLQIDPGSLERMAYTMNRAWRVTTDDNGVYERTGVDFETDFVVRAEADGYADTVSEKVRIAAGQSEALVNVTLSRGSAVSGTARYESGEPAGGVELTMMSRMGFNPAAGRPPQARTDAEGAFAFENVPAGDYVIRNMERFNPLEMTSAAAFHVDGRSAVANLEVVLPDPAETNAIRGIVVAADGTPVAGANVSLDGRMGRGGRTAVSGADGRFAFEDVEGFVFTVKAEYESARASAGRVRPGADLTLTLAEPARIDGVVLSAAGDPVADCSVSISDTGGDDSPAASIFAAIGAMGRGGDSVKTDAEGRFAFEDVSPGSYVIEASLRGSGEAESEPVEVAAGQSRSGLRLVLELGVRVAGIVRDPSGGPVSGASVSLVPGEDEGMTAMAGMLPGMNAGVSGRTNDAGEFDLADIAPGVYSLVATHSSFARATLTGIEVTKGRDVTGLTVRLSVGAKVSGRLAANGQPQAGVVVNLMGENGTFMAFTDAEGAFNLDHVPQGTYVATAIDVQNMAAQGMAGLNQVQRVVDIEDGKPAEIDFSPLPGSVPVTGQLTTPVQGMTVATLRREGGPSPLEIQQGSIRDQMAMAQYLAGTAMIGADGSFTFNDIPPGTYVLDVFSLNFDMANMDMEAMMNLDPSTIPHTEQVVTVTESGLHIETALP